MTRFFLVLAATIVILVVPETSRAQTGIFRDDFDAFHDYVSGGVGSVPAGGIWTGIHNATNGSVTGGLQAILQSNGVDGFGTPRPGVLFVEDLSGGPTGAGVGWEGGRNTSPFLFRDVPAAEDFDVKLKISAQTAGQWSSAGLVARLKGPPVGLEGGLDPTENFVTAYSFRTDNANPDTGTMLTKHIQNGAQVVDANNPFGGGPAADLEPLPVYVRMTKVGNAFTTLSSLDGAAWFSETVVNAPNIAAAGGTMEVGLAFQMFGAGQGNAELDWFELVVGPVPPKNFLWAPTGAGNWSTVTNWQTDTTPGFPNANNATVRFESAITAPSTVFTDANVTAKRLVFANANKYALAGTGTVTLDADTGNALIDVTLGSHEIQTAVTLNDNLTVTAAAGTRLDVNNRLNLNGKTMTTAGAGIVSVNNNLDSGTNGLVANSATLQGSGTINGSLANNAGGVVSPGNSVGTLSVDGTYTQAAGSTLLIELGGASAGQFDKLKVGGALTAGGTLDIDLISGFVPSAGNSFDILDFATASGSFMLSLPSLSPGLSWNTSGVLTTGVLSVGAAGDADFDNDGDVDGGDFLTWQRNLGLMGANNSQGDADGNGTVNAADLTIWRGTFGGAVAVSAAVPEPGACILLSMAMAALVNRRRRR